jgi:hypothetical protein
MTFKRLLYRLNHCFFISIVLLSACSSDKKNIDNSNSVRDSINNNTSQTIKNTSFNDALLGVWIIDEQPVFEIKKDSVFYIDSNLSYKYSVADSNISIFYDDFIYKGISNKRQY